MVINKICKHCGAIGQGYIEYDDGWFYHCHQCGYETPLEPNEVPKGVDPHRYEEEHLQSDTIFQMSYPLHMPSKPNFIRGE